jgi:endonuclease G
MRHLRPKQFLIVLLVSLLVSASAASPARTPTLGPLKPQDLADISLVLGNPSNATADTNNRDNLLMEKRQFVLSYNDSKGGANWVSWHLQEADIGTINRGDFHVDINLPAGFKRVTKADYNNSGFDHGHLCNSKDRTNNRTNNDATFNMTNILPQSPGNNQGPWKKLEDFGRTLAKQGNELYILAGAFGSNGAIAGGKVNVPKTFWKVIVILPIG